MKVLVCVRRLDKGGAEMLECRLAQYLNKLGVETHLLAQYNKQKFEGIKASEEWKSKGVREVYFLNSQNNVSVIKSILIFITLIKREQYDIIISTNSGLDTLIGFIKLFVRFKHVIAFHTYVNKFILKHYRIKVWRYFVNKADYCYSITDFVLDNTIECLGIDSNKNQTIYNSIEPEPLNHITPKQSFRKEQGLPVDAKIILVAGRIEARKGFDLVVSCIHNLLLEKEVYLVVVGEGYAGGALELGLEGFAAEFKNKVKSLGISDKVLLVGYRNDLNLIMKEADLYVHLARHEGFGLVLLEAIAAKLPIVASAVGGIPEVLKNTPYTPFALDDKKGITHEIYRLLYLDKQLKRDMVEEAYKILNFYTDDRRVHEVKQLLDKIMA